MHKEKTSFTFKSFLKKNWLICSILGAIPIIVVIVFVFLMAKGICNISDLGSMLGGTLSYLGTVMLGITSVWQVERQRQENIETLAEQQFQINKGIIQISAEVVFHDVVLVVKNIGNSPICNGLISFDAKWLDGFNNFGDNPKKIKDIIIKSLSEGVYLAPQQEIRFFLHRIGENHNWYTYLSENECECEISYTTCGQNISERIIFRPHSVLASFYGENTTEKIVEAFENMNETLVSSTDSIQKEIRNITILQSKSLKNQSNNKD